MADYSRHEFSTLNYEFALLNKNKQINGYGFASNKIIL